MNKSWDEIKKDEEELKQIIQRYLLKWSDWTPKEDGQILSGNVEYCCNYHLNNTKKKFPIGTIILVVSGKRCPECDVSTLGIYSKE